MQIEIDKVYLDRNGNFWLAVFYRNTDGMMLMVDITEETDESYWVHADNGKFFSNYETTNDLVALVDEYFNYEVDEVVLVRNDEDGEWEYAHFAGIDEEGKPLVWADGRTQWTTLDEPIPYNHCIKFNEEDHP